MIVSDVDRGNDDAGVRRLRRVAAIATDDTDHRGPDRLGESYRADEIRADIPLRVSHRRLT